MTMMFAGLTSAFVVSKSRVDWLTDFELPTAFIIALLLLVSHLLAKKAIQKTIKAHYYISFATLALGYCL
jgi:cytochrome c oxidase subunit 3